MQLHMLHTAAIDQLMSVQQMRRNGAGSKLKRDAVPCERHLSRKPA